MRFTWDPAKSTANLALRGLDFVGATMVFDGPVLEREDTRGEYGERRIIAIGLGRGVALTVVYTDRLLDSSEVERRVISARRSNRRERKAYEAFTHA